MPQLYPQDYAKLPSDIAQEVLKKLTEAWKSFFALKTHHAAGKLPHKPGLVRYRKHKNRTYPKDFTILKSPRSYSLSNGQFALSLPADLRTKGRLCIPFRGKLRYTGDQGRAELRYDAADRCWRVTVSINTPERVLDEYGRAAGIDLGLRVALSLSIEGQAVSHHFRGRELLKEFDYWTRRLAEHQYKLSQRGLKTGRQLKHLYQTRARRLEHSLRSIARAVAGLRRSSKVKTPCISDGRRASETMLTVRKDWRGRLHNFWNFNRFGTILTQALERVSIRTQLVGERGTSSTCPWTLNTKHKLVRSPRSVLKCKTCEKQMHSDAAGSCNILAFNKPGIIRDGAKAAPAPRTHAWHRHVWNLRLNRCESQRLAA